jgi:hypothetical protein
VPLPAYFPDALRWPPIRIRSSRAAPRAAEIAFAARNGSDEQLVIYETIGGDAAVPERLMPSGLSLQAAAVTVGGRPAILSRVRLADGSEVNDLTWIGPGGRVALRGRGDLHQLLRMAESLERGAW